MTQLQQGAAPEATSGFQAADGPGPGDVELAEVAPGVWRLSDARLPVGDPFRLLAFVELREEGCEVLQLGTGFELHLFPDLDQAVAFVVRTATEVARRRLGGTTEWIGEARR